MKSILNKLNNKWIRGALPALLIHCSIGSVYAWSMFVLPISKQLSISTQLIQFAFSLAIFFLGMSASFGGKLVEKNVKKSAIVSTICFCSGLLLTSLAIKYNSLIGIYIGYGCLMGIGLGIGYITPIKTLMLWFKEQKGLATGIAITGFGFASAIASPLITFLLTKFSIANTFNILGVIYFIPMIIAFLLIKKPYWYVESIEESEFKVLSMFKNKTFIGIWVMIFLNISSGLALISVASPIMSEINTPIARISLIIAIMGIFNGLGRLLFSALSDKLKDRNNIYKFIFGLSAIMMIITIFFHSFIIVSLCVISTCYGAGFSNLPSLLSDKFGMDNISKIHGLELTAWAMAGLVGNQLSTFIKNTTGSYLNILVILLMTYAIGFVICSKISNKKSLDK